MDESRDATPESIARTYYAALDDHDYERLAGILADAFVHDRPDRTFEGREEFVAFMREGRPDAETSHPIDGVYRPGAGAGGDVAIAGRLLDADGAVITRFLDVFVLEAGRIRRIETYTR